VVVPEQSAMNRVRTAQDTVVVGVSDTAAGIAAMRFAFDEASRRRVSVTAVRAWHSDASANGDGSNAEQRAAAPDSPPPAVENQLETELAGFRQQYPNVRVLPLLVPASPADAILQAASNAVLVVLGAHHSENRWSSRLGPVPQTILHHTDCPVVLVGTPAPRTTACHASDLASKNPQP
jgi:nucleotide-binding universal stress UspA family protein